MSNRIDAFFTMAVVEDADKIAYQDAYNQIKRELEQNLRVFKSFIDLKENNKVALSH